MLKGFAITPVVLGRIGIGEMIEDADGSKRLKKLNHIVLTTNFQDDGQWRLAPEMNQLIEQQKLDGVPNPDKLRSIPVRIMFDTPESNFHANYSCFNQAGRPLCAGDGETATRIGEGGAEKIACPGNELCAFGRDNQCKQFGRLIVGLESNFESDPLSGFMFRTSSFNSIRALTGRLSQYAAALNGKMAGMPCNLVLRAKSTAMTQGRPIFYLDLEPRDGFLAAAQKAHDYRVTWESRGLNREAFESAIKQGLEQSAFYENLDDGEEVVEEFFSGGGDLIAQDESKGAEKVNRSVVEESSSASKKAAKTSKNNTITEEQVSYIGELLSARNEGAEGLIQWLGHPESHTLADLNMQEGKRAIELLTSTKLQAKAPEPAVTTDAAIEETKVAQEVVQRKHREPVNFF